MRTVRTGGISFAAFGAQMAKTQKLNSLPEVVQSFMITNSSSESCYMQLLTASAD
jgi:hypothetical protein